VVAAAEAADTAGAPDAADSAEAAEALDAVTAAEAAEVVSSGEAATAHRAAEEFEAGVAAGAPVLADRVAPPRLEEPPVCRSAPKRSWRKACRFWGNEAALAAAGAEPEPAVAPLVAAVAPAAAGVAVAVAVAAELAAAGDAAAVDAALVAGLLLKNCCRAVNKDDARLPVVVAEFAPETAGAPERASPR
jgi:hypothetical protein